MGTGHWADPYGVLRSVMFETLGVHLIPRDRVCSYGIWRISQSKSYRREEMSSARLSQSKPCLYRRASLGEAQGLRKFPILGYYMSHFRKAIPPPRASSKDKRSRWYVLCVPKLREWRFSNFEVVRSDEVSLYFLALVRGFRVAQLTLLRKKSHFRCSQPLFFLVRFLCLYKCV